MLFGFSGIAEYITATFKYCNTLFVTKYLAPTILLIDTLFGVLFQSTGAIYFLMILYCLDFFTGVGKAIYYSFEYKRTKDPAMNSKRLISKKFPRCFLTMLAALLILTLLNFMGIYSIIFYPAYSIFYSIFLGQQFISIAENLSEVKLIPLDIVAKLKERITNKITFKNEN